jgi:hypothetical protein
VGTRPTCYPVPMYLHTGCHLAYECLDSRISRASLKSRLRLHLGSNSFRTDLSSQPLAGNDLCHDCDTEAEVNRMTHYALRVRRSARQLVLTSGPQHPCSAARFPLCSVVV